MNRLILLLLALAAGAATAQSGSPELNALLSGMAKGNSQPISAEELAKKLDKSRDIVKEVGSDSDVRAFDAQLTEAERLAAEGRAVEAGMQRRAAELKEESRLAAIRHARLREEQGAMAWTEREAEKNKQQAPPGQLPSQRHPRDCGDPCVTAR